MVKLEQGFTLIELMIAVAIIGILAAIAYPSYNEYVIRTNRVDTQNELMRLASSLQEYKVLRHSYNGANLGDFHSNGSFPRANPLYNIQLDIVNNSRGYVLSATPIANTKQQRNGIICLNQDNQTNWIQLTPSAHPSSINITMCSDGLNATSTWNQ